MLMVLNRAYQSVLVVCAALVAFCGAGRAAFSGRIDLGAGDMAVHIDSARHDDHSGDIDDDFSVISGVCRSSDAATILHPDIARFSVDPISRIISHAAF